MSKEIETADRLRAQSSRLMTEAQVAFLRDVQGYIDFAIRNGLTFSTVAGGLVHDLNELARYGFDDEAARARGFQPKVAGFRQLSGADFGATDEDPGT